MLDILQNLESLKAVETNRRDFLQKSLLAVLSGVAVTVSGCGKYSAPNSSQGGNSGNTGSTPAGNEQTSSSSSVTGQISGNHGHQAVISALTMASGGGAALDIQGSSGHFHMVNLSAAQISSISTGGRVVVSSSTEAGHGHSVQFN